jgi:hypothetical protein
MSNPTFPLTSARHKGKNDQPPEPDAYAIFDARGYWANLAGYLYQQPAANPESRRNCETVARMLNAAYEQGKADKLEEIRDALGIES